MTGTATQQPRTSIYFGTVSHRRLGPVTHALAYDVASILIDVDDLERGNRPSLLSYNRFNLFSVHDRDHGEGASIREFAWSKVKAVAGCEDVVRIFMLCYPRVLGYGFNPLTAYYALAADGELRMVIYEVHNTFGGRHSYVTERLLPDADGAVSKAAKVFRVSPFNKVEGDYTLRATLPGDTVTLGVALAVKGRPVLKAWFSGRRKPLTNLQLIRIFIGIPLMSLKIIVAIHWEALKLWKKGLRLQN